MDSVCQAFIKYTKKISGCQSPLFKCKASLWLCVFLCVCVCVLEVEMMDGWDQCWSWHLFSRAELSLSLAALQDLRASLFLQIQTLMYFIKWQSRNLVYSLVLLVDFTPQARFNEPFKERRIRSSVLLGHEVVKQQGMMLREVLLLDRVLQTQQLAWDQCHLFSLPLSLKHRTEESKCALTERLKQRTVKHKSIKPIHVHKGKEGRHSKCCQFNG